MPIGDIIKRASNYLLRSDGTSQSKTDNVYEENEVLFCKNNVCVHPPAVARQETDVLHYPGYLTVSTKTFTDQYNNAKRNTLLLTWIPNAILRKCPASAENKGASSKATSQMRSCTDELKQHKLYNQIYDWDMNNRSFQIRDPATVKYTNPFLDPNFHEPIRTYSSQQFSAPIRNTDSVEYSSDRFNKSQHLHHSDKNVHQDTSYAPTIDDLTKISGTMDGQTDEEEQLKRELEPLIASDGNNDTIAIMNVLKQNVKALLTVQPHYQQFLTSVNITIANPQIHNQDHSLESSIEESALLLQTGPKSFVAEALTNWMTPEMLAFKHNLTFPESASSSPIMTLNMPMKCRRFSVDLSQMRSLRLFFNDENCTSGQLVIASRESQYKILHFHHGGLDHLAQVLHQWHCLLHNIKLLPGILMIVFV